MPFGSLMRDTISVFDENGNLVAENQAASVQGGKKVFTKNANFTVDVGYLIERKLPSGHVESYRVIEPNFMAGLQGIPPHYQMTVTNIKAPASLTHSIVNNHITVSDQARFYQDSVDNSINTYNSYTLTQYEKALDAVNNEVSGLDLHQSERDMIKKSLEKIEHELKKSNPNKDILSTCISFLPTSIATLESVINLGQMLGIS